MRDLLRCCRLERSSWFGWAIEITYLRSASSLPDIAFQRRLPLAQFRQAEPGPSGLTQSLKPRRSLQGKSDASYPVSEQCPRLVPGPTPAPAVPELLSSPRLTRLPVRPTPDFLRNSPLEIAGSNAYSHRPRDRQCSQIDQSEIHAPGDCRRQSRCQALAL